MTPPVALTIAGSDSGGGAGIQADLRTFAAFGVHGCTAIAALTAQNTHEVRGIVATDPGFLREQIEAVLDDLPVAAVKTGMLATAANVRVVAELAAAGRLPNLVVDPVLVSSSGRRLLDENAERAYLEELIPQARVVTPNTREAQALADGVTGGDQSGFSPRVRVRVTGALLLGSGARFTVVKGGDSVGDDSVDVVMWNHNLGPTEVGSLGTFRSTAGDVKVNSLELTAQRVATANNHGTGCSFAAAIAAQLARGVEPLDAIAKAKEFVHAALVRAADWELGAGHGPIDHLDFTHPFVST